MLKGNENPQNNEDTESTCENVVVLYTTTDPECKTTGNTLESLDNLLKLQCSNFSNCLSQGCELDKTKNTLSNMSSAAFTLKNGGSMKDGVFEKMISNETGSSISDDNMKENREQSVLKLSPKIDSLTDNSSTKRSLSNHEYMMNSKFPRKLSTEAQRLLNKAKRCKKKSCKAVNHEVGGKQSTMLPLSDDDSDSIASLFSSDDRNSECSLKFPAPESDEIDAFLYSDELEKGVDVQNELRSTSNELTYPETKTVEKPSLSIQRQLFWEKSRVIPRIVKEVLRRSGFRFTSRAKISVGRWGNHIKCREFHLIGPFQKVNHYPGTFHLGRKDTIWKDIKVMQKKFGLSNFDFMPCTYILPQESTALQKHFASANGKPLRFIVKPPASARGTGIRLIEKYEDIPENTAFIVQKYLDNPCLINGHKFDIRLYVYVPCIEPLRIYLYNDGLVRFASRKYSSSVDFLEDKYVHLTNYSVNKYNSEYSHNQTHSSCEGHKWSLKSLWKYFQDRDIDYGAIWKTIKDIVIKSIISSVHHIRNLTHLLTRGPHNVHELFGFDILLDDNYRPWLLEVNISPSLNTNSALDVAVKENMLIDMLNLAGFVIPECGFNKLSCFIENEVCNYWLLPFVTPGLTDEEVQKFQQSSVNNCEKILDSLTPNEVRILMSVEDEFSRQGAFSRIFPSETTSNYLTYMIQPSHYDLLLCAWTNRYQARRNEGIDLLKDYSRKKYHLKNMYPLKNGITFAQSHINFKNLKTNSKRTGAKGE